MNCSPSLARTALVLLFGPGTGAFGQQAVDSERDLLYDSYLAHVAAADGAQRLNDVKAARRWLEAAPEVHRDWEWSHVRDRIDTSLARIEFGPAEVSALAVSPDGSRLVAALSDGTAALIDTGSRTVLGRLEGHAAPLFGAAFSSDGSRIATSSRDRTLRIWDAGTLELLRTITDEASHVMGVSFSPDGARIAASLLSVVKIWSVDTGQLEATLEGHTRRPPVVDVAWSPDGTQLASASWDNWTILWDAASGQPLQHLGPGYGQGDYMQFRSVDYDPSGARVLTSCSDGSYRIFDTRTGELVSSMGAHDKELNDARFSPDGEHLATASQDNLVRLFETATGRLLATLQGHVGVVRSVVFTPDGGTILSAGDDGALRFWSTDPFTYEPSWQAHESGPWDIDYSADGTLMITAADDVAVWDVATRARVASLEGHTEVVASAALDPDGRRAVTGSNDRTVRLFDVQSGECLMVSEDLGAAVQDVAFSPDGARFAGCFASKSVRVWDNETQRVLGALEGAPYYRFAFHPSAPILAAIDQQGVLRLFALDGLELLEELTVAAGQRLTAVAFDPGGARLAIGVDDSTVRLVDVTELRPLHVLKGHDAASYGLAFLSGGTRLASASYDASVKLWDPATGACTLTLPSPEWVWALAVAPDGRTIAFGPVNGTVVLAGASAR